MRKSIVAALAVLCSGCATSSESSYLDSVAVDQAQGNRPQATLLDWLRDLKRDRPWTGWHPWPGHGHPHGDDCEEPQEPEPPQECGWQAFSDGLAGANVNDILFDWRAPGVAYAATGNTLWKSLDSGLTWRFHASVSSGGFTQLLTHGPDAKVLLASTVSGLLRSTDAGKTWERISLGGLPLSTVATSQIEPRRIYVAADTAGVFRSEDGGYQFREPGFAYPAGATMGLSVSPEDSMQLVASLWDIGEEGGLIGSGSLVRSANGGANWETVLDVVGEVGELARCGLDPDVLIAATAQGVARSSDGGTTWSMTALDGPERRVIGVTFDPTDCNRFYALQYLTGPRLTTDGGSTFGPPLVDGVDIVRKGSFPGSLSVDPYDPTRLVLATSGGIFVSSDAGAHFSAAAGVRDFIVTALASSPREPSRIWLGSWGQGVWTRASSQEPWRRIPGSDLPVDSVMSLAADPFQAGRVLVGTSQAWLNDTQDPLRFAPTDVEFNATSFAFDPVDSDVIYAGTQVSGIFKSVDGGANFAPINGNLQPWATSAGPFIDVRAIYIDPTDRATLYIATNGRGIYKSTDSGGSWQPAYADDVAVLCLVGSTRAPRRLYACVDGVQVSDDGGETWRDNTLGLPTLEVQGVIEDPDTGFLYASSPYGVFVQEAPGKAWQGVDTHCLTGASAPVISAEGGKRYLVVGAGAGAYRRQLR